MWFNSSDRIRKSPPIPKAAPRTRASRERGQRQSLLRASTFFDRSWAISNEHLKIFYNYSIQSCSYSMTSIWDPKYLTSLLRMATPSPQTTLFPYFSHVWNQPHSQGSSHSQRLHTSHHPRRCMRCRRTTRTLHQKPGGTGPLHQVSQVGN